MDKSDFQDRIKSIFHAEVEEHVRTLERDLLNLEVADGADRLNVISTLFRTAHTLKGAAHSAGHSNLEQAAHALETAFQAERSGTWRLGGDAQEVMLELVDLLRQHVELKTLFGPVANRAVEDALPVLRRLTNGSATEHSPPVARPDKNRLQMASERNPSKPMATPVMATEENYIRVPARRLDRLLSLASEQSLERQMSRSSRGPQSSLDRVAAAMEREVVLAGMAPVASLAESLHRVVRDLGRESSKSARLVVSGGELELDRNILGAIRDPLIQLIRNAVAHGLESPRERVRNGKPAEGTIRISATLESGGVHIAIADDGRGIDLDAIRRKLGEAGENVDDSELIQRLFVAGFSTQNEVTTLSGRGVGLDIVANTVNRLRGAVLVHSTPGKGTEFVLQLPLSLSMLPALLVRVQDAVWAMDAQTVDRLLRIERETIVRSEGQHRTLINGESLPVYLMSEVLSLPAGLSAEHAGRMPAVLVHSGSLKAVFLVDELIDFRVVSVRALGSRFPDPQFLAGATLIEGGVVAPILHMHALLHKVLQGSPASQVLDGMMEVRQERRPRLVLAEDSLTTRTLVQSLLEAEGFEVLSAEDGIQAWSLLQRESVDLLVSDVQMPGMDGFRLTELVRGSKRHQELPIILITALKDDRERMQGMQVGADAYILKSHFDQSALLATIQQFL